MKALSLCALVLPATLVSQQRLQFTAGGIAAQEIVHSHVDATNDRLSGLMLGGEGGLVSDRLIVRLRYAEGRIKPKLGATDAESRDVVEGGATVGYRAMPWLTVWGGPSARAYTVGDNDQRWLTWTAGATARGTLLPGRMQTFVELWGALAGNVGNPAMNAGGGGANGGLEVRLGELSSFWGRLGYRIESTHTKGGTGTGGLRETVESLTLSFIYGLPQ